MRQLLAGGFALTFVVFSGLARAEDAKDPPALSGVWERESNGLELKFEFAKDTLKIHAFSGDNGVILSATYTADKEGLVKVKITDVEEKGNFPAKPEKGLEISFKWKVKDDMATLDELKAEGVEDAKPAVEGEYKKKKDK